MKELSQRCMMIAPSMTLEIDAKAKRMKSEGEDVIGFGAGEPDFDTPVHIKEAGKKALDKGLTKYTPASGTLELREAICKKFQRDNGLSYQPNQIVVSNGAKHSLFNAFAALLNPGDEVIVPTPYWVTYPELIQFNGGKAIFVDATEASGFIPTIEDLKKAITPKTKAILINSPNNPTGAIYSEQQLREIAQLVIDNDLYIVSDEIYEELIYDKNKHFSCAQISPEVQERTIVVNGFSKAYAMTGWRVGYTASSAAIAKIMGSLQSHVTSNPNSIAQYAATEALEGPQDNVKSMVHVFAKRRDDLVARINAIDGLSCRMPEGAFYVMLNISGVIGKSYNNQKIEGSMDFCNLLLDAEKVAVVPGIAFGADEFCRLSYATSDDNIKRGMERIAKFVSELN